LSKRVAGAVVLKEEGNLKSLEGGRSSVLEGGGSGAEFHRRRKSIKDDSSRGFHGRKGKIDCREVSS
jgi:hypothetical protein